MPQNTFWKKKQSSVFFCQQLKTFLVSSMKYIHRRKNIEDSAKYFAEIAVEKMAGIYGECAEENVRN